VWLAKHGKMDLITGVHVGIQVAQGLQKAHQQGIWHLDLKPANILLLKKTSEVSETSEVSNSAISVKIIDFGLAKIAISLTQQAALTQKRSAQSQFVQRIFGTFDYAPPEQWGDTEFRQVTEKSDVFALGKTLYHLFTGLPAKSNLRQKYLPERCAELHELLEDCVEIDPAERPDIATVLERLQKVNHPSRSETHRNVNHPSLRETHQKDNQAWQSACQQNTAAGYQAYLKGNTLKNHADEAEQRIQSLIEKADLAKKRQAEQQRQADETAWQNACQQNTQAAYQAYLNGNTLKKHADEVQQRLKALAQKTFAFEVVTVNAQGEITHREKKQARYEAKSVRWKQFHGMTLLNFVNGCQKKLTENIVWPVKPNGSMRVALARLRPFTLAKR